MAEGQMEQEGHVHIMYPHLARRRRRTKPPAPRSHPTQSPYGHGLDGTNAPPIVVTRPAAYRKPVTASTSSGADKALRDSDALLLARLAESKEKQEKMRLKRKASTDANPAKRPKTQ
ncbi:hypothetical protein B0H11DRAFT_2214799 [Mycena galericulata]|nr:hypothetical protein B0H11DRAFT_2214799 [Mycena galericulata]